MRGLDAWNYCERDRQTNSMRNVVRQKLTFQVPRSLQVLLCHDLGVFNPRPPYISGIRGGTFVPQDAFVSIENHLVRAISDAVRVLSSGWILSDE